MVLSLIYFALSFTNQEGQEIRDRSRIRYSIVNSTALFSFAGMNPNTYDIVLILLLLWICIAIFLNLGAGAHLPVFHVPVVVFILVMETWYSTKRIKGITTFLLIAAFFGWTFIIMHWPFGHLIFFGCYMAILLLIFSDIFKTQEQRHRRLLIMLIPVCGVVLAMTTVYRIRPADYYILWAEAICAGIVACLLVCSMIPGSRLQR